MDRKDKNKRKQKHKNGQKPEKKKTPSDRHRSPHRHQSGVQEVFTIEASNHQERPNSRNAVQKISHRKLSQGCLSRFDCPGLEHFGAPSKKK
ncbi:hypothetical protein AVEN_142143-1 [Araneus ventricosus]|uniref:Uncharacterized protein n=1 Tax=Araneus ventricosus TaxID=182803 RepID=A0A4Y2DFF2_ARAVE|nr:hypothetical protein AVEN_142143-1 [Araneus ventricosus]